MEITKELEEKNRGKLRLARDTCDFSPLFKIIYLLVIYFNNKLDFLLLR